MSQASVKRTISKSSTKQRQTKSNNSTLETNEGGFLTLCIRLMLDKLLVMYVVDKKHSLFFVFLCVFFVFFFFSMNETVSFLLYGNRNDLYYNRFSQVIAHIQIVCACAPFTFNVLTLFICLHFFH